jgi:hypothetical protein
MFAIKLYSHASQSKAETGTCAAQSGHFLDVLNRGCFSKCFTRILEGTASGNDLEKAAFLAAILMAISFISNRV